jgi:hypothetical protein
MIWKIKTYSNLWQSTIGAIIKLTIKMLRKKWRKRWRKRWRKNIEYFLIFGTFISKTFGFRS